MYELQVGCPTASPRLCNRGIGFNSSDGVVVDDIRKGDNVDIDSGDENGAVADIGVVQVEEVITIHEMLELVGNDSGEELSEFSTADGILTETADPRVANVNVSIK
jgi:hypothetical protein